MTEQIDFYILSQDEAIPFACRLISKAYQDNLCVYAQTETPEEAKRLDDNLWTFRDISFVPHKRIDNTTMPATPIIIGSVQDTLKEADVLVSLTVHLPENYALYRRILIVVPNDETRKAQARELFKSLKKSNLTPIVHNV